MTPRQTKKLLAYTMEGHRIGRNTHLIFLRAYQSHSTFSFTLIRALQFLPFRSCFKCFPQISSVLQPFKLPLISLPSTHCIHQQLFCTDPCLLLLPIDHCPYALYLHQYYCKLCYNDRRRKGYSGKDYFPSLNISSIYRQLHKCPNYSQGWCLSQL